MSKKLIVLLNKLDAKSFPTFVQYDLKEFVNLLSARDISSRSKCRE